jgi:hypothetical protein
MRSGWDDDPFASALDSFVNDRTPIRIHRTTVEATSGGSTETSIAVYGFFRSPSDSHANTTIRALYTDTGTPGAFSFTRLGLTGGASDLITAQWLQQAGGAPLGFVAGTQRGTFSRGCPSNDTGLLIKRNTQPLGLTLSDAGPNGYTGTSGGLTIEATHTALRYFNDGAADDLCFDYKPALI